MLTSRAIAPSLLLLASGWFPAAFAREPWAPGESRVIFSEVHYQSLKDEADDEFLEIHNAGYHWIDLEGWKIEGGVEFTFPGNTVLEPGGFLAVARSADKLRAGAPSGRVIGDFEGRLANSGEILSLHNRTGRRVAWLHYRDGRGREGGLWPRRPDGDGPSLELIGAPLDWDQAWYWRPSFRLGGTPGRVNSVTPGASHRGRGSPRSSSWDEDPARQMRINEVAGGEGAFVELINTGEETARLTGIRLEVSGSSSAPVKLAGSVSGGRLSIASGSVVTDLLADGGDHLLLVSSQGYLIDTMSLEEDLTQVSVGRFPDGRRDTFVYADPSRGRSNPRPEVPRVCINEIQYHGLDSDGEDEFVEIHNGERTAVSLAGWRIDGGIRFRFPDDASIDPGGHVVVARNPDRIRARLTVAAATRLLGPYQGKLSNRGDVVQLEDAVGNEVDRVEYEDRPPWPREADGKAFSLELLEPALDNCWAEAWTLGPPGGSPARQNARTRDGAPPAVARVDHEPAVPAPREYVTVHAWVVSGRRLSEVSVLRFYVLQDGRRSRVEKVRMSDRGSQDDGLAGDGHYTARFRIPSRLPEGALLGYRIQVRDSGGREIRAPEGRDYLCVVEEPDDRFPGVPCYRIVMAPAQWQEFHGMQRKNKSQWFPCTFIPTIRGEGVNEDRGRVYHGAAIRYRGRNSLRPPDGRFSYRVRLAPGDYYNGYDRLILNAFNSYRQKAGGDLLRLAGVPAPRARNVRLKTPGFDDERYVSVEVVDSEFLDDKIGDDSSLVFRGDSETGAPSDLSYHGDDMAHYEKAYRQMNHKARDDLGRLPGLLEALASSVDEGYRERIDAYVDVEEWVTFFAANNLLGNREGGITLDRGDDYFIAERPDDGRFILIPWDNDSTFRDEDMPLFRPALPPIKKLLAHPTVAPLFHRRTRELLDGPLSVGAVALRLKRLQGTFRSEDLVELLDFTRERQLFLRAQYRLWPHASVEDGTGFDPRGPAGFGARLFVSPTRRRVALSGYADPALAWSVRLNGVTVDYNAKSARWTTEIDLAPEGQDLWLEFLEGSKELSAAYALRIERPASGTRVEGLSARLREWSQEGGPYHLVGEVVVPGGSTLRIGPGTEILCAPGSRLVVRGRLEAEGTSAQPVAFRIADGQRPWRGILLDSAAGIGGGVEPSRIVHCRFEGGVASQEDGEGAGGSPTTALLQVHQGRVTVEHSLFRGVRGPALGVGDDGALHGRQCRVVDGRHGVVASGGEIVLESCAFARLHGFGLRARGLRDRESRILSCTFRDLGEEAVRVEGGALDIRGGSISLSAIGLRLLSSARVEAENLVVASNAFAVVLDRELLQEDATSGSASQLEARGCVFCPSGIEFLAGPSSRIDLTDCHLLDGQDLPPRASTRGTVAKIPKFRHPLWGDFRRAPGADASP